MWKGVQCNHYRSILINKDLLWNTVPHQSSNKLLGLNLKLAQPRELERQHYTLRLVGEGGCSQCCLTLPCARHLASCHVDAEPNDKEKGGRHGGGDGGGGAIAARCAPAAQT